VARLFYGCEVRRRGSAARRPRTVEFCWEEDPQYQPFHPPVTADQARGESFCQHGPTCRAMCVLYVEDRPTRG
jgi:hypothetical protein